MNDNYTEIQTINKYDRLYGALHDVALFTKPSTIKNVQPLTGRTETFVVQTCRHEENGDYIFVEVIDESGMTTRIALPPKVANAIASQRDALTARRRSISSKTAMKNRMAAGWVPSFKKKAAKKKG